MDRTSCTSFLANVFRVLMSAAAYVLMQEMRRLAAGTSLAAAQVTTLRERLFKIAAWVKGFVRRIVIHFPLNHPWLREWRHLATVVGALSG
jgi:hypothetical protein